MSVQPFRGAGLRVVLALFWALAAWTASPPILAAEHDAHCASESRDVGAHPHHDGGPHRVTAGAIAFQAAETAGCAHCPDDAGCPRTLHCAAGGTLPPLALAPVLGTAADVRLHEGWPADRPLSSNPTPPTPPPPSIL